MSKCADDAGRAALSSAEAAGALDIIRPYLQTYDKLRLGTTDKGRGSITSGGEVAVRGAIERFTREEELLEGFTRKGGIEIKAGEGKKFKREAQQKSIVNQFHLAKGYAFVAGIARANGRKSGVMDLAQARIFSDQAFLHDSFYRRMGIPLTTVKPSVLAGDEHWSHVTFGDLSRIFKVEGKLESFANYFLRSTDNTKNIQTQNTAEAVRRIVEHADTFGRVNMDEDIALLRPQVIDALTNPSGLGKPKAKSAEAEGYDKAIAWGTSPEGKKLIEELADELLSESTITNILKLNEEMRLVNMAFSRGDGLKAAQGVIDMLLKLPNPNDRVFAYGDVIKNGLFRKMLKDDPMTAHMPGEMNLAWGENFIAEFLSGIDDSSLALSKTVAERAAANQADKAAKAAAKAQGKKVPESRKTLNRNRQVDKEFKEAAPAIAAKAKENMQNPNVRVGEYGDEAAELAETYRLQFDVGPLMSFPVKAFNWVNDRAIMGEKMKTQIIGAENFRKHNAASMVGELGKFYNAYGRDKGLFNKVFIQLQKGTPVEAMTGVEREIAETMNIFIQDVFGIGSRNNLDLNAIDLEEFTKSMKYLGMGKLADEIEALDGFADDAVGEWWTKISVDLEADNALDIMSKTYSAMQLSRIKPAIAGSLRQNFSHTADGLTYQQAIDRGYKPIAETDALSRFINIGDKPVLFHPQIIRRMGAVNGHLNYERNFDGNWQKFWNIVDPTIGVMKSSITLWRPGHHMVSAVGNTLMNTIAGVKAGDYAAAVRIMTRRGDLDDVDEDVVTQALRGGDLSAIKIVDGQDVVELVIDGKKVNVPLEILSRGGEELGGVPISAKATKDIPDEANPSVMGLDGITRRNPALRGVSNIDHALGRFAAARDNVARWALYVRELRRKPHATIEDAILYASSKVHEFHPTVGTLSAGERKYARRIFYFYTWQKQAMFKIMELAANQPALVTMPSKALYALATANGMNPESFGDPWNPEGLYASYYTNSVFGPQWEDIERGAVGIKPASPQLDIMDAYFSTFSTKPNRGFWEGLGEMMAGAGEAIVGKNLTPIARIPMELLTGNRTGDMGQITNLPEYLLDQTGLGGLSRVTGFTPWGAERSDIKEGEFGEADRERQWFNTLTGFKLTYYENPASVERARQERIDYWLRYYKSGKYYVEDK
jgi:hypothetical protein